MKILYVPDYMRAALKAAGAEEKNLYCLEKLLNILSPEDVAFYCHLNLNPSVVIPQAITSSLEWALVAEGDNPFPPKDSSPAAKEFHRLLQEFSLGQNVPTLELAGKDLTCDLMDENTILFTHIPQPSAMGENVSTNLRGLFDRVIQQLYAFMPFEELCKLPLFAGFLETSQTQQGATARA